MHRISQHPPQRAFSGWYLVFLVLALAGVVVYIVWNLAHPQPVHAPARSLTPFVGI